MFKKVFLSWMFSAVLISSAGATEASKSNNQFLDLVECMKNAPIDKTSIKGVSHQQIVLISVLENLTNQKVPAIDGIDIDYSKVYELVVKHCPNELNVLNQFVDKAG